MGDRGLIFFIVGQLIGLVIAIPAIYFLFPILFPLPS